MRMVHKIEPCAKARIKRNGGFKWDFIHLWDLIHLWLPAALIMNSKFLVLRHVSNRVYLNKLNQCEKSPSHL